MTDTHQPALVVPQLQAWGHDLVVYLPDGGRGWHIRDYFAGISEPAGVAQALSSIASPVALSRHPDVPGGQWWGLGSSGADVMVATDFDVSIAAGDGADVVLTGAGTDYLGGDAGNDWLYAGGGNDALNGGGGADRLYGEAGNDSLQGGDGDDLMVAGAGNDDLWGGPGNDLQTGNSGNDLYCFGKGGGHDILRNNDAAGDDTVQFEEGITREQLWFRHRPGAQNDLEVTVIDTGDTMVLKGWFSSDAMRVDRFRLSTSGFLPNGQTLAKDTVDTLVQAMGAFAPPPMGSASLPESYQQVLNPVLAASWQ